MSIPDVGRRSVSRHRGASDDLQDDRLVVSGPADEVQACLEIGVRDRLIKGDFNVSTMEAAKRKNSWNLYHEYANAIASSRSRKRKQLGQRCCSSTRPRARPAGR